MRTKIDLGGSNVYPGTRVFWRSSHHGICYHGHHWCSIWLRYEGVFTLKPHLEILGEEGTKFFRVAV